jgi:hypothetical protein
MVAVRWRDLRRWVRNAICVNWKSQLSRDRTTAGKADFVITALNSLIYCNLEMNLDARPEAPGGRAASCAKSANSFPQAFHSSKRYAKWRQPQSFARFECKNGLFRS